MIISDNQAETRLIITINDTSIGDLPLIITISDTCKNQSQSLDFDNTINLSILIVSLATDELQRRRKNVNVTYVYQNLAESHVKLSLLK